MKNMLSLLLFIFNDFLMPFSQSSQISTIIGFIEILKPNSVLDIGTGMGQYGFLMRNNLEHINLFEIEGNSGKQRPKEQWQIQIDGIEGFAGYITPVHEYCYNKMMIGNALDILPSLPSKSYDLIIAIDILEHFEMSQGQFFLEEMKRICRQTCLISTPKEFIYQQIEANSYENHLSFWTQPDLKSQHFNDFLPNEFSWIAIYNKE